MRSRAKLDYPGVQAALDAGRADEPLQLLREIGTLRLALEAARGGISLDLPSQEVDAAAGGGFALEYAAPLPVEGWNAQISLLAGMEAAKIMIDAHVGHPAHGARRPSSGSSIGCGAARAGSASPWPDGTNWSDVVRDLDRADPDARRVPHPGRAPAARRRLREARRVEHERSGAVPIHAGVAAPYAHVTAPLRRLADRYANEIVLAHCAGVDAAGVGDRRARRARRRRCRPRTIATRRSTARWSTRWSARCSRNRIGEQFDGVVVDRNKQGVVVQLRNPAVVAPMDADVALGATVRVTLVAVDPVRRRVELALAP